MGYFFLGALGDNPSPGFFWALCRLPTFLGWLIESSKLAMAHWAHRLTLTFCSHVSLWISSALFFYFLKNSQWAHPYYLRQSPNFKVSCSATVIPSVIVITFAMESDIFIEIRYKNVYIFCQVRGIILPATDL